jgi:8-oxo-dGTP pyrophosphatase MutT (NUDIX family)
MSIVLKFKDDQYMFKGVTHTREIVRAILLDKDNCVCLEKLKDDDGFGPRDYYETPGGGIKTGESHIDAMHREIEEEVGYKCEVIKHIADVHDYYNLIKRKNHNYFYLVRATEKVKQHLEPDEVIRIEKIIWVPIDEAISLYENMQNVLVGRIVKQRELPILKMAKEMIDKNEI